MQSIQQLINDDEIKKKFTELRQELGNKLKYTVDELCEIYYELYRNGYIINGFLGSGAEGPVFSVININEGNQIAVKVISGSDASKIDNELKIIERFKNQPYIHQYIRSLYSKNKKYFFYLTEKLTCDLESIMLATRDKQSKFSYNQIIAFAIQVTTALSILESNKVIHSDLKPANILYDKNNKCFKMSDYGFSKIILQKIQQQSISATKSLNGGNLKYAAPEVLEKNSDYTCKIDIYGLGLILLELGCGGELSVLQIMQVLGGANSIAKYLNQDKQYGPLNTIIQSMLVVNRQNRISASDLLQKLKELQNEEESNLCNYLDNYLQIRVDEATLQSMKQNVRQLYSSSLTQVNLDGIVIDNSKRIFMRHHSLEFKDWVTTAKQLTKVEEALAKYHNDINTSLDVALTSYGYNSDELAKLGASVVASRLASGLEKCSASIISLSLSFEYLKIGPEGMESISQSMGMMHQNLLVVGLKFQRCNIGSDEIKYLSQSLEKCDKMTTLGLHLNGYDDKVKIGPTGASYLASNLPKCKSLTEFTLSLYKCDIKNEGLQSLGSGLSKCEKLTRLNVQIWDRSEESPINEQSIEEFGSSLARCPNLITLSVEFQQSYQSLTYAITPSLTLCKQLTTLTLFLNRDDAKNISTLQTNLKKCQNLTSLCLSLQNSSYENTWNLGGTVSLAKSLEESNLTTLKLIVRDFGFGYVQSQANRLGESLSKFKKLASLYLFFEISNDNPTQFISTLLSDLAENKNITTLSLGAIYTDIISSNSQIIGEGLEKCKYLQTLHLYLWENSIESEGALVISQSLSKCVHLTALDLSIIEEKDHQMDSVSPTITNDLKEKCKNLGELKVDIKSEPGEDDTWKIKLGILSPFESSFWRGY